MTPKRITLTGIRVEGPLAKPATVDFKAGLNVIAGASDTGKTYIANTFDFLLGATAPPPDNPQSRAYTRAYLGLLASNQHYTVSRDLRDGVVQLHEEPLEKATLLNAKKHLSSVHRAGSTDSLSYWLLSLIGLEGRVMSRNQYSDKASLTMRNIAHLLFVSEENIISRWSPALTGDLAIAPLDRSIFSYFLTGIDDAELTVIEKPKDRIARLETEEGVLRSILESKELALSKLVGTDGDAQARLAKIDTSIQEATQFVSATRDEISALENLRNEHWGNLQKFKSKKLFVTEQLKRLRLLNQFYETDRMRLEAVLEAGEAFEQLPGGICAVCGSKAVEANAATSVEEFKIACTRELQKLANLSKELQTAVSDMEHEEKSIDTSTAEAEGGLRQIEHDLTEKLKPQSSQADLGLTELIRLKGNVARAVDLQIEIANLNQRLNDIGLAKKAKKAKTNPTGNIGTAKAARFCESVQETLAAWKYPLKGNVSFDADPKKYDLVIGDQDRGSMGKGYRAITHAAFVIGLMRYCRRENIPHPGFVILDTPLNPFKGPDEGPSGTVNDEMKDAFYQDLARDASGDQFIILENTEPPKSVIQSIQYQHFSKNTQSGRYGFFPTSP